MYILVNTLTIFTRTFAAGSNMYILFNILTIFMGIFAAGRNMYILVNILTIFTRALQLIGICIYYLIF